MPCFRMKHSKASCVSRGISKKFSGRTGSYNQLANTGSINGEGVKRCTHLATKRDVDVHMKFLALSQMEQQYGSPKPDFLYQIYKGASQHQ